MPIKFTMPNRLILLCIVYSVLALTALVNGVAVVPALLLLMVVLSIFAKQQATGWILRGLAVFILLSVSMAPYLLQQNPQLAQAWQTWWSNSVLATVPQWAIFAAALLLSMLHLWLLFTAKVTQWFQRKNSFNIMS
ncbi:hypothetical protein [Shewanella sp.]|uniref:hypothetical protein n=1 Tax=Shewanella sp. TaxID=50422 RepID=UPI003A988351